MAPHLLTLTIKSHSHTNERTNWHQPEKQTNWKTKTNMLFMDSLASVGQKRTNKKYGQSGYTDKNTDSLVNTDKNTDSLVILTKIRTVWLILTKIRTVWLILTKIRTVLLILTKIRTVWLYWQKYGQSGYTDKNTDSLVILTKIRTVWLILTKIRTVWLYWQKYGQSGYTDKNTWTNCCWQTDSNAGTCWQAGNSPRS